MQTNQIYGLSHVEVLDTKGFKWYTLQLILNSNKQLVVKVLARQSY